MGLSTKVTSAILSAVLAVSLCPAPAFAAGDLAVCGEASVELGAMTASSPSAYKSATGDGGKASVSGMTFSLEYFKTRANRGTYRIALKRGGASKVLVEDVDRALLTNGRFLFYSKYWGQSSYKKDGYTYSSGKFALYRMDVSTGKEKKLTTLSGDGLTPYSCDGKFVYAGSSKSLFGADLYAINISTGKRRFVAGGVKGAGCAKGRVVTWMHHNVGINLPVYSFKSGGTGKKQIAKAMEARVVGSGVQYIVVSESGSGYKKYKCTVLGKNKKALTGWVRNYSSIAF